MKLIQAKGLRAPAGHYSQAVVSRGLAYLSGILPDPAPINTSDSFERQVKSVFEKATVVLEAAGSSLRQVVQCTVYLTDIAQWGEFNRIYSEIFADHRPARTVVPVQSLNHGFLLEVQIVAESSDD